jgi:hypothetical protein
MVIRCGNDRGERHSQQLAIKILNRNVTSKRRRMEFDRQKKNTTNV